MNATEAKRISELAHKKAMAYYEMWQLGRPSGRDNYAIFPAASYEQVALNFAIEAGIGEPGISILRESSEALLDLANGANK